MTPPQGRPRRAPFERLPPNHGPGLRIGLFGGSFDPPHRGHRLASLIALRRLQLDRVWWLVTPGNPLKDTRRLPSMSARLEAAALMADDPCIDVTGVEEHLGTRYTIDVIRALKRRCPRVRFVWIMGADNLQSFHRWQHWAAIAALIPIAVVDRPGATLRSAQARAGIYLGRSRLTEADAKLLPASRPPAFVFLHGPRSNLSSTALRNGVGPALSEPPSPQASRKVAIVPLPLMSIGDRASQG